MSFEKMKVENVPFARASAVGRQPLGFTHRDVIPNGAEGPVRDRRSDAAIPAVNGTATLNSPPLEVILGAIQ
jgi:hypothetical protein